MAAVYDKQPSPSMHGQVSMARIASPTREAFRPKQIVITAADFSYGVDEIESTGETYLTPYHIHGDEKPFFNGYRHAPAPEFEVSPRPPQQLVSRSKVVVQEQELFPSPPPLASLVAAVAQGKRPLRQGIRWKEQLEEYSDEVKAVTNQSQYHSTKELKQPTSSSKDDSPEWRYPETRDDTHRRRRSSESRPTPPPRWGVGLIAEPEQPKNGITASHTSTTSRQSASPPRRTPRNTPANPPVDSELQLAPRLPPRWTQEPPPQRPSLEYHHRHAPGYGLQPTPLALPDEKHSSSSSSRRDSVSSRSTGSRRETDDRRAGR